MIILNFLLARGRYTRTQFWVGIFVGLLSSAGLSFLLLGSLQLGFLYFGLELINSDISMDDAGELVLPTLGIVFAVFLTLPAVLSIIAIRRLHDRGRSGWPVGLLWLFVYAYQYVHDLFSDYPGVQTVVSYSLLGYMAWLVVELVLLPGTRGPNRFGPDPHGRTDA